ncbi:MarR family winged helix-turn-helix transcriptional regulator [Dongia sp. agr-C8]
MTPEAAMKFEQCNCLAIRQAARYLTQFYDQFLAPSGLRSTQFSILGKLRGYGPLSINALAKELVMDRTTLGRNMLPLQREGLIEIVPGTADRRTKELRLTEAGIERLRAATPGWNEAQSRFEQAFGRKRSSELRALLDDVVASEL